jgi:hypothetical protein
MVQLEGTCIGRAANSGTLGTLRVRLNLQIYSNTYAPLIRAGFAKWFPAISRESRGGGAVGDMGFALDDFKTYFAGLRKPDWTKIFAIVIEDHYEMFVRLAKR